MIHVDLHTDEMSKAFVAAPMYEKNVTIQATEVTSLTDVVTVLRSGFVETTVVAKPGEYIVRNPGGEEYVLPADKFWARYDHVEGDIYKAKGLIRAFKNHTGDHVTIVAPWGEEQYGEPDCFFAQALDNPDVDRYIIENEAFFVTYQPV